MPVCHNWYKLNKLWNKVGKSAAVWRCDLNLGQNDHKSAKMSWLCRSLAASLWQWVKQNPDQIITTSIHLHKHLLNRTFTQAICLTAFCCIPCRHGKGTSAPVWACTARGKRSRCRRCRDRCRSLCAVNLSAKSPRHTLPHPSDTSRPWTAEKTHMHKISWSIQNKL